MSNPQPGTDEVPPLHSLSDLLAATSRRQDYWRSMFRTAEHARRHPASGQVEELLSLMDALLPLERFWAYPGPDLLTDLRAHLVAGDMSAFAMGARKVAASLHTKAYRRHLTSWDLTTPVQELVDEPLPPGMEFATDSKPYFEVLVVASEDPDMWGGVRQQIHRLRRPTDDFIYEIVLVSTFEDALVAIVLNADIQAVVAYEGFSFHSELEVKDLERFLGVAEAEPGELHGDLGLSLFELVYEHRPELDCYLLADRSSEVVAGDPSAAHVRRIFYSIEEVLELHLSVLEGVRLRYQTPFFDNLKQYAQRPMGTFHALPIARGKSIFKSNWIRDMGEFYGENLFLAESSATTGGLDSLLEPTGNIKLAQDLAARAFGADHAYYSTNGTSSSNKIVGQAILRPGDIVLIDRDCHKSHHYGCVLSGAQPYYIDAFPLPQYSMYGGVPIKRIKAALLQLKSDGKLDQVRMLILTNATFDGHMADVKRTMTECLAIKPDLVFLWDEAWSAFARFSPLLRRRTAMGGASYLRKLQNDPAYRLRYQEWLTKGIRIDVDDPRAIAERLLPDPDEMKVRVYQTNSVHKSMSALRQGSLILVADQEFSDAEEAFKEAYYTHTSTSPNLQVIASLDVARRQMELEGYELVGSALELTLDLREQINRNPLISKYFKALTPAEMIPAELRHSALGSGATGVLSWDRTLDAVDHDEFFLDPTRVTVLCGTAGFDGTEFKDLLASKYEIQINKTSRNSVLFQLNINNTRSDIAHLIKVLADISRTIDRRLESGTDYDREAFEARVRELIVDTPELPDFSHFHDVFRDDPTSASRHGHIREAFYLAYDADNCEHIQLYGEQIEDRLANGPELVGANFIIPYPPGFPVIVPGQVVTADIVTFLRALDVNEIHGYDPHRGLKLLRPQVLAAMAAD